MATQWTAGLVDGTPLPASTLNRIGAAWETWTPTVSSSAGTITSYTVNMAKYAQVQKITIAKFRVTITSAGTAAGNYMYMTMPLTAASDNGNGYTQLGTFREGASTGFTGNIFQTNTNTVVLAYYNNNGVIQTNHTFAGTIVYEAA